MQEVQEEMANQADIYRNGVVTFLAGGAARAHDGFLRTRTHLNARYSIRVQLPDSKEMDFLVDRVPAAVQRMSETNDPVAKRAWM